jgi:hypothetical protein
VDAHDTISPWHRLDEREEREHEDDDAEDEHERAPPSAPGGGAGKGGPAAEQVAAAPKAACGGEGPHTGAGLRGDQGLATPAASEQRPSCQAALRAPTARAMKAWHGAMPSRFARTPRATHVDEDEDEDDQDEKRRAVRAAVACGPGRVQME